MILANPFWLEKEEKCLYRKLLSLLYPTDIGFSQQLNKKIGVVLFSSLFL